MAYAYASGDPTASMSSLASHVPRPLAARKTSGDVFDVLAEFQHKIDEDDNYISFFQGRIKLEEAYVEQLQRLYDKSKAVDSLQQNVGKKGPRSTTRRAWEEVRDYTQREIQSREAMIGALREAVVKDLARLKEEQSRIRHNLRDNIKLANEMYDEHARNQVPKLKRAYWQKCLALEDHKRQELAIQKQAQLLATSNQTSPAGTPLHEHPNALSIKSDAISPPMITPPLPPMSNAAATSGQGLADTPSFVAPPHERNQSISFKVDQSSPQKSTATRRDRSGSASGGGADKTKEVLNEFAHQSKKGFNAIMQKLGGDKEKEKDGDYVVIPPPQDHESLQRRTTARGDPTRGMGTMRGIRIKREADEADKAYRLGVFHLESLRLRRQKLYSSAITNLDQFNDELNKKLQSALHQYIDVLQGTAATNAQGIEVARVAVNEINVDHDTSLFRTKLRADDVQKTAPVPYQNFYVGECKSLIFGVSLTDYDYARGEGSDHGRPPTIVEKCISALDERALDAEGIYRVSGRHAGVQKLVQDIERDENTFSFSEADDVYSISNVLKQYLRELPEPVFNFPHTERVKHTENRESHIGSNFSALRARLRRLPPIHQTTFQAIIEHLSRVESHSAQNKMDAKNLAVVFSSVLFGQEHIPADGNILTMNQGKDTVLEDIIRYSDLLFGAESPYQAPGVLPPGSALSRSGVISYHPVNDGPQPGSSRTRVEIINPTEQTEQVSSDSSGSKTTDSNIPDIRTDLAPAMPAVQRTPSSMPDPEFTPDDKLELLFDPKIIPASMRDALGPDYHVRPLASTDLMRSHFGLMATLTSSPPIAPSIYTALFQHLQSCPETYYILVIIDRRSDQMVAHGTLVLERKFIHGGSTAGHIEDIVVSPEVRGGGLGKKLLEGLKALSVGLSCYKVILDCQEDRVPFYEKCGFKLRGRQMAYYTPGFETSPFNTPGLVATVPGPNLASSKTGSHLPLPELRSTLAPPTLPPRKASSNGFSAAPAPEGQGQGQGTEPSEPGTPRSTASASSDGAGVTYIYPTASATATADEYLSSSQGNLSLPADAEIPPWASDGLGSSEIMGLATEGRSASPLPPGAAPPLSGTEPERIGRS